MKIDEQYCEKLLEENKTYSAHIIVKIMRKDLIAGKNTIIDWLEHLYDDDLYLINTFLESYIGRKSDSISDYVNIDDMEEAYKILHYVEKNEECEKVNLEALYELSKKVEAERRLNDIHIKRKKPKK